MNKTDGPVIIYLIRDETLLNKKFVGKPKAELEGHSITYNNSVPCDFSSILHTSLKQRILFC